MGIFLVSIAFIFLRFFFTCPTKLRDRFNSTGRNLFFCFQQVIYWGLLIVGLFLVFTSNTKIGLITLGCFLLLYNISISSSPVSTGKRIPILGNPISKLIGVIMLVIGFVLSFSTSFEYGFISLGSTLFSLIILRMLIIIEIILFKKKHLIN